MSDKVKFSVNMEGALFEGQPCDIRKVSRGWLGIIDNTGRAKTVRASAVTLNGAAEPAQQEVLDEQSKADINQQTESNTMATSKAARKRSTKVTLPRKARKAATPGVRKIGKSEFTRFAQYTKHKTAAGNVSHDNSDAVSAKLRDLTLDETYEHAAKKLDVSVRGLKDQYKHLNPGQMRMCLGNRLRGLESKKAKAKE